MRPAAALLCLLVAGCGHETPVENRAPSTAQIERLSRPQEPVVDPQAAARLEPLTPVELAQLTPLCQFDRFGRALLVVSQSDAIARVAGVLHHFAHASPAGPTGGFFEDRQVSVSVGRTGTVAPGEGAQGSWPGRITVTNRRAHAQVELEGSWHCEG